MMGAAVETEALARERYDSAESRHDSAEQTTTAS